MDNYTGQDALADLIDLLFSRPEQTPYKVKLGGLNVTIWYRAEDGYSNYDVTIWDKQWNALYTAHHSCPSQAILRAFNSTAVRSHLKPVEGERK